MKCSSHGQAALALAITICMANGALAQIVEPMQGEPKWWLELSLKARTALVDPGEVGVHLVEQPAVAGFPSPDGTKIVFIGSDPERVAQGHDFDLFVADIDADHPSGKSNPSRLTTGQHRPTKPIWLPGRDAVVFLAQRDRESTTSDVWIAELGNESEPIRISNDRPGRISQLDVTADGSVAYVVFKSRDGKAQLCDLVLSTVPKDLANEPERSVLVTDQHISSYEISPDGLTLAWSGLGAIYFVDPSTGQSEEVLLHGIHRQLVNHTAHTISWRPDGEIVAITCGFLGGISRGFGEADKPFPKWFAEDKVFLVPTSWRPTEAELELGENERFPSPLAIDPDAEISPESGAQDKPWWIRGVPMRPLDVRWLPASEAVERVRTEPLHPDLDR